MVSTRDPHTSATSASASGTSASVSERDPFGVLPSAADDLDKLIVAFAAVAEPSAPPPGLRTRLLARVSAVPVITHATEPVPGIQFLLRADGDWAEIGVPGVQMKYLQVDPARRYVRTLIRMAAGARFPPHRHQAREETLLLEGDLRIDGQDMQPGDYCVAQAGTVHGTLSTEGGALFLALACLDDRPVSADELAAARAEQRTSG